MPSEIATITLDHWYGESGTRIPGTPNLNVNPVTVTKDPFYPSTLLDNVIDNTTFKPNPPRSILGFFSDPADTAGAFAALSSTNNPYSKQTIFLGPLSVPNDSAVFNRQGAEVEFTSFYCNGGISLPVNTITPNANAPYNNPSVLQNHYANLRKNQVASYLICQYRKEPGSNPPDWSDILEVNTSPKVCVESGNNRLTAVVTDGDGVTGVSRFAAPNITIQFNERSNFKILSSEVWDLDNSTIFTMDWYSKLKMKQMGNGRAKKSITTTYQSGTTNSYAQNAIANVVYLLTISYGIYDPILTNGTITPTGTTVATSANGASYYDLAKIYPAIAATYKISFKRT
jgi:hypothetical protein